MYQGVEFIELAACEVCPLNGQKKVPGCGKKDADVLFLGQAPADEESRAPNIEDRRPFIGPSGNLLRATLKASIGWNLDEDVYRTNPVLCQTPGNREPTTEELACCKPRLDAEIAEVNPKLIVGLGGPATGVLMPGEKVTAVRGWAKWDDGLAQWGAYKMVTIHPAAVLHGGLGYFDDIYRDIAKIPAILEWPYGGRHLERSRFVAATSVDLAKRYIAQIMQLQLKRYPMGLDLEWDTEDPDKMNFHTDGPILEVGIATKIGFVFIFPSYIIEDADVFPFFKRLLENDNARWVGQNLSSDKEFLAYNRRHRWGVKIRIADDVMLMSYALDERQGVHDLETNAVEYLGQDRYKTEVRQWLPTKKTPYSNIPTQNRWQYLADDASNNLALREVFIPRMKQEGVFDLYTRLLLPAAQIMSEVVEHGVKVDLEYAERLKTEYVPKIEAAANVLKDLAAARAFNPAMVVKDVPKDGKINVRSPKQLAFLYYDIMGLRFPRRTTDKDFIERFVDSVSEVRALADFRTQDDLYRRYVVGIVDDVWEDGRCHPDILLHGTVTGRLAIHNPPLQTIPREELTEGGENTSGVAFADIKQLFTGDPTRGTFFANADYKNLELWCAAHHSKDKNLLASLQKQDFHYATGAIVFNKPYEAVTKQERYITKFVTFGLMYGREAASLASGELKLITGGSVKKAQEYIDAFWTAYPDYRKEVDRRVAFTIEHGYDQTEWGRKRRFKLISNDTIWQIKKQVANFFLQSFASDVCLWNFTRLYHELTSRDWGMPLFSVHDSICFELKEAHKEAALHLIDRMMREIPFETVASFIPDIEIGASWGETVKWHPSV